MRNHPLLRILPVALAATSTTLFAAATDTALENWPSWRGPASVGVAPKAHPPVEWDETRNIRWKVSVPGDGNSTPAVWGDLVFVLSAVPTGKHVPEAAATRPTQVAKTTNSPASGGSGGGAGGGGGGGRGMVEVTDEEHRFTVFAYERSTGKLRWQDTPRTELPHEGHHKDHGFASASPVTDGEVLIAYFGSRGLHAYDLSGKPLWRKDLGRQTTRNGFGEGSSPVLHGDAVVVVWDHEGEDFVAAFDKRTGRELWRRKREESTNWTTPLVVEAAGRTQVVVNSGNKVRSYDLADGSTVWEAAGQTQNAVPTPVTDGERVYVTSGWRGAAFQAIRLDGKGDLTGTPAIEWTHGRNTPYIPSPLLYGGRLYFFSNNNAQLTVLESRDGTPRLDAVRLDGIFGVYASPLGADGKVYVAGRNGVVWVLKEGPALEVLAKNRLEDGFDASPVAVGDTLFLRGKKHLYAVAEPSKSAGL
jgi:outer membrane protein assembly factor BamB